GAGGIRRACHQYRRWLVEGAYQVGLRFGRHDIEVVSPTIRSVQPEALTRAPTRGMSCVARAFHYPVVLGNDREFATGAGGQIVFQGSPKQFLAALAGNLDVVAVPVILRGNGMRRASLFRNRLE